MEAVASLNVPPALDAAPGTDDALHVEGAATVVHTRRGRVCARRTFAEPVQQALWARMDLTLDGSSSALALCVVLGRALHLHYPALGRHYDVPLPFALRGAFALADGLLLARAHTPETAALPALFTLTHPLGQLVPMGADAWPAGAHIVAVVHDEAPLIIAHDPDGGEVSAWLYWWRGSPMAVAMGAAPVAAPVAVVEPPTPARLVPPAPHGRRSLAGMVTPQRRSLGGRASLGGMATPGTASSPSKRRRISIMTGAGPPAPFSAASPGALSGSPARTPASPAPTVKATQDLVLIAPDLLTWRIWSARAAHHSVPLTAFCSHSSAGDILLNIVSRTGEAHAAELTALTLCGFDQQPVQPALVPAFQLPRIASAVPMQLTRLSHSDDDGVQRDIVVVQADGTLHVMQEPAFSYRVDVAAPAVAAALDTSHVSVGSTSVMDVDEDVVVLLSPPAAVQAQPSTARPTEQRQLASIQRVVRDLLVVELPSGQTAALRLAPLMPRDDALVVQVQHALELCLPPALLWTVRVAAAVASSANLQAALAAWHTRADADATPSAAWIGLCAALSCVFGTAVGVTGWLQAVHTAVREHVELPARVQDAVRFVPAMALSLHILHEELSLRASLQRLSRTLRRDLLVPLATHLHWRAYQALYLRNGDLGENTPWALQLDHVHAVGEPLLRYERDGPAVPPSMLDDCLACLQGERSWPPVSLDLVRTLLDLPHECPMATDAAPVVLPTVTAVGELYRALRACARDPISAVAALDESGLTARDIDEMPLGIGWPLQELVRLGRETATCKLVAAANASDAAALPLGAASKLLWLQVSDPMEDEDSIEETADRPALDKAAGVHWYEDGTALFYAPVGLRFAKDLRVYEVQRLLTSARPISLRASERLELSDHDRMAEYQARLAVLIHRTFALAPGRALLTWGMAPPLSWHTVALPDISVVGKVYGAQALTVNLEDAPRADVLAWPQFHNGVAAGLRIPPGAGVRLDSSWLRYNSPVAAADFQAWGGVLMGVGLNGHLGPQAFDLYAILVTCQDLPSIGILLGVAASKCGTMDAMAEHIIYPHVPALLPSRAATLPTPPLVQTAAIFALGLLFQGTGHRRMVEVLLDEIGRSTLIEAHVHAYSLSAALAVGLVVLGRGNTVASLLDMGIPQRLLSYMGHGTPAAQRGGIARLPEHVTTPGATLAYGLMYLRTNDEAAAAYLVLPQTAFALDYFRPDVLLMRTVARGLILWDAQHPTREHVEATCPAFVREQMMQAKPAEQIATAYRHIVTGVCFVLALKHAGTQRADVCAVLLHYFVLLEKEMHLLAKTTERVGLQTCVATVALSLSLVMAGSGDLVLLRRLRKLHNHSGTGLYGFHMAVHMALGFLFLSGGTASLKTDDVSIALLVVSLYPRFPSTPGDNLYHLQALRHMHVAALERRSLVTLDATTRTSSPTRMRVDMQDGQAVHLETPCLLPERAHIRAIVVDDERFWPQTIPTDADVFLPRPKLFKSPTVRAFEQIVCVPGKDGLGPEAAAVLRSATAHCHLDHLPCLLAARLAAQSAHRAQRKGAPIGTAVLEHLRVIRAFASLVEDAAGRHRFLFESVFVPGELELLLC